jgi:hypothetical protein
MRDRVWELTPIQRFRHEDPSWFRKGHTTSLLASVTEKLEVKDDRGGIASVDPATITERRYR